MEILLSIWNTILNIPWWAYPLWYLLGICAVGSMLYDDLVQHPSSYENAKRGFWLAALGGGLFFLLASLSGDLRLRIMIPGPWARRLAKQTMRDYEEYGEMLKADPGLPEKYGLMTWREIYAREKFFSLTR